MNPRIKISKIDSDDFGKSFREDFMILVVRSPDGRRSGLTYVLKDAVKQNATKALRSVLAQAINSARMSAYYLKVEHEQAMKNAFIDPYVGGENQ